MAGFEAVRAVIVTDISELLFITMPQFTDHGAGVMRTKKKAKPFSYQKSPSNFIFGQTF